MLWLGKVASMVCVLTGSAVTVTVAWLLLLSVYGVVAPPSMDTLTVPPVSTPELVAVTVMVKVSSVAEGL
jgi:hypothetical protein